MIYSLHHSTGALLIAAEDREQVVQWARRQLGRRAANSSITEIACMEAGETVEKDGTGISAREAVGCHPVLSIMANFAEDALGEHGGSGCRDAEIEPSGWRVKETTWH